jgi:two-component system, sporulation sensor kinase E
MQQIELENDYREAYNRVKCFKGIFTHDISNLFQIISNSIELCGSLFGEHVNMEEIINYFDLIGQQVNRGKKLINNVRNLSLLEDYEMPLESVDVYNTLKKAMKFTRVSFPRKKIDFTIVPDHGKLHVMANVLLLDVFENLIMNSIIYNKNEIVKINVNISKMEKFYENYIKIEFKDNGLGIEDSQKVKIFQGKQYQNTLSKGMGIGLSLVAKLIDLYNGKISIEDRIKGDYAQGSNFILLIPESNMIELYNMR